jgi:hypothetical protein
MTTMTIIEIIITTAVSFIGLIMLIRILTKVATKTFFEEKNKFNKE